MEKMDILTISDAKIRFPNFSGKESTYNRRGCRNFCVIIPDSNLADRLSRDGWNVRVLKPLNEGDEPEFYIQVNVSFDYIPPKVIMVTSRNKTKLDESTIGALDYAEIRTADVAIRPHPWTTNGKSGIKGYLKTLYVTVEEDEFADKYGE